MPAKSMAQFRLMQAAKHNPEVRKRTGITKSVAEEFTSSSPGKLPEHAAKARALRKYKSRN